jgi:hypothetical protein
MQKANKAHTAWAIKIWSWGPEPCLCGVYYFAWNAGIVLPQFYGGCTTAIFKTREQAREHCRMIRSKHNNARVVKISVEIKEV